MTLPNKITITPNDVNGAPYLGYDGGDGVVYVPRESVIGVSDALENLIIGIGLGWDLDGLIEVSCEALARARGET